MNFEKIAGYFGHVKKLGAEAPYYTLVKKELIRSPNCWTVTIKVKGEQYTRVLNSQEITDEVISYVFSDVFREF